MKKIKKVKAWAVIRKTVIEISLLHSFDFEKVKKIAPQKCYMIFKRYKEAEVWRTKWNNKDSFKTIPITITYHA